MKQPFGGLPPGHYLYQVQALTGMAFIPMLWSLSYTESIESGGGAYLNPIRKAFHLRVYLPYDSKVLLEGWDIAGRVVMAERYSHLKGSSLYTIGLKGLSQGLYSFRLQALSSGEGRDFRMLKKPGNIPCDGLTLFIRKRSQGVFACM